LQGNWKPNRISVFCVFFYCTTEDKEGGGCFTLSEKKRSSRRCRRGKVIARNIGRWEKKRARPRNKKKNACPNRRKSVLRGEVGEAKQGFTEGFQQLQSAKRGGGKQKKGPFKKQKGK